MPDVQGDREVHDRKREFTEWLVRRRFFAARLCGSLRIQYAEIDSAPSLTSVTTARGGQKRARSLRTRNPHEMRAYEAACRLESSVKKCHLMTHVIEVTF